MGALLSSGLISIAFELFAYLEYEFRHCLRRNIRESFQIRSNPVHCLQILALYQNAKLSETESKRVKQRLSKFHQRIGKNTIENSQKHKRYQ